MPGVNILSCPQEKKETHYQDFIQVQESMLHYKSYSSTLLLTDRTTTIGFTAYNSYPRKIFETDRFFILLEGMIYNKPDILTEDWLFDFTTGLARGSSSGENLKDFLRKADGEFILVIYDKTEQELTVLNDKMGRLPLYYYKDDDSLFISREVKFIIPFIKSSNFDKQALTEYLLFGFPLGERTLVDNVHRVLPATLIKFNPKTQTFLKTVLLPVNFENGIDTAGSSEEQINDLRTLFLGGLENRITATANRKPVLFLSGGLDSRATLAGLVSLGQQPAGVTHIWKNKGEEVYAASLSREFGIETTTLRPSKEIDFEYFTQLVKLKDGMNPTSNAPLLHFMEQTMERFDNNIVIFNGLYGGEIFRYFNITKGLTSVMSLSRFLMTTPDKYRYSVQNTCAMLSVCEEEVLHSLAKHISCYAERDIYKKYNHFKFERDYRWAGEGEDRTRFFSWETTPYYSHNFFDYAMSIDENRKDTLFFRNFLYALDPRTCNVNNYNDGSSLKNVRRLRMLSLAERAVRQPMARKAARSILDAKHRFTPGSREVGPESLELSMLRALLLDLLHNSTEVTRYFSYEKTQAIIREEYDLDKLHRILTLFLYMDNVDKSK